MVIIHSSGLRGQRCASTSAISSSCTTRSNSTKALSTSILAPAWPSSLSGSPCSCEARVARVSRGAIAYVVHTPGGGSNHWASSPPVASSGRIYNGVVQLSDRRIATFFSLVLASGMCLALLAFRMSYPHGSDYRFLAWNLFLAWIPFVLAVVLYDSDRRGVRTALLVGLGAAWLLFLPNAPYIVTDFIHVGRVSGAPIWFDASMTASFAGVGLVLGLGSVILVQGVIERHTRKGRGMAHAGSDLPSL